MQATETASSDPVVLGDVIRIVLPELQPDADADAFEAVATGEVAADINSNVPGAEFHVYEADRGDRAGDYLLLWNRTTRHEGNAASLEPSQSPFPAPDSEAAQEVMAPVDAFIADDADVTDYALIGSDQFEALFPVDVLGSHFLKVLPDRAEAFETFVKERLHPTLKDLMPGMPLLYYKGIAGARSGDYLLVFAIRDPEARELYFPTDQPETPALYAALEPLESLGQELTTYLEDGSWLDPSSGGAAAYFESTEWTDFVRIEPATVD